MEKHKKKSYNNNKFKISATTWNEEFELPNGSYSVSDIQDYFEYLKKDRRIALSSNDDKIIQTIDSIETYAYGMSKDLVYKKEEVKCNNIIKQYKNV